MAQWSLSKNGQLVATLACIVHAINWIQGFPTHPHLIPSLAANISPTNWEVADEAITNIGPGPKALLMTYSHGDGILHVPGANPSDDQYAVYPMTQIAYHRVPVHKYWYLDDQSTLLHTEVIPGHAIPARNSDLALNYDVPQTSHQTLPPKAPSTKLRKEAEPFIPRRSSAKVGTLQKDKTYEEKAAVKTLDETIGQQESTKTKELCNTMGRTRKGAAVPTPLSNRTDSVANPSKINDKTREEFPPETFVTSTSDLYPPGSSNLGSSIDNFQTTNIGKDRLADAVSTTELDKPSLSLSKEESSTNENEEGGTSDLAPKFDKINFRDPLSLAKEEKKGQIKDKTELPLSVDDNEYAYGSKLVNPKHDFKSLETSFPEINTIKPNYKESPGEKSLTIESVDKPVKVEKVIQNKSNSEETTNGKHFANKISMIRNSEVKNNTKFQQSQHQSIMGKNESSGLVKELKNDHLSRGEEVSAQKPGKGVSVETGGVTSLLDLAKDSIDKKKQSGKLKNSNKVFQTDKKGTGEALGLRKLDWRVLSTEDPVDEKSYVENSYQQSSSTGIQEDQANHGTKFKKIESILNEGESPKTINYTSRGNPDVKKRQKKKSHKKPKKDPNFKSQNIEEFQEAEKLLPNQETELLKSVRESKKTSKTRIKGKKSQVQKTVTGNIESKGVWSDRYFESFYQNFKIAFHPGSKLDSHEIYPGIKEPKKIQWNFEEEPNRFVDKSKESIAKYRSIFSDNDQMMLGETARDLYIKHQTSSFMEKLVGIKFEFEFIESISRYLKIQFPSEHIPLVDMDKDLYIKLRDMWNRDSKQLVNMMIHFSGSLGESEGLRRVNTMLKQISEYTTVVNWKLIKESLLKTNDLTRDEARSIEEFYKLSTRFPKRINQIQDKANEPKFKQNIRFNILESLGVFKSRRHIPISIEKFANSIATNMTMRSLEADLEGGRWKYGIDPRRLSLLFSHQKHHTAKEMCNYASIVEEEKVQLVPGHASAEMHWVLETCTLNDSFQMQPWI